MKKSYFKPVIVFAIVLLTIIIFLQGSFLGSTVHADDDSTGGLVPCNNKCTLCHVLIGFQNILKYLTGLLFVATMFFVTLNGALMMVSAGSKKILEQVKTALNYCLKGFLLFLICWVIVTGIMKTLGYKQLNNWWQFECDTTQVEPPPASPTPTTPTVPTTPKEKKCKDIGGICRIWNTSMEGQTKCEEGEQPWEQYKCENSGDVCCKAGGNLSPKAQEALANYMKLVNSGLKYGGKLPDNILGNETANCGSSCRWAWRTAGLPDFWNVKRNDWDGDKNSLRPGDICVLTSNDPNAEGDARYPHAFMIMDENGMTTAASNKIGIGISKDGLNYNIGRLKPENLHIEVVHIADYIK
ncbi:MAG: hypothetical protein PHP25_03745 [Candidatus Moranbacteria bacterium]|nr:hypothetical protein [Candidatus Moranbacteria bacterium]